MGGMKDPAQPLGTENHIPQCMYNWGQWTLALWHFWIQVLVFIITLGDKMKKRHQIALEGFGYSTGTWGQKFTATVG